MANSHKMHSFICVFCLLNLFLLDLSAISQTGGENSKGRVFMLSFLLNRDMNKSENSIIVMSDEKTTVFVYVAYHHNLTRYLMKSNDTLTIKLPFETTATKMGEPERKTTSVYSTEPVSVYGVTFEENSSGAFMSIPIEKWGDHYIVATFDGGGEVAVIAAEDETSVTVVYNFVRPTRCFERTRPIDVTTRGAFNMNHEDVLRIACWDDMTGSIIKGSKPIGVIAGNRCARIPNDSSTCDHIVEMMIPSRILGQEYFLAAVAGKRSRVRVIYAEEGVTNVTLAGGPAQEVGKFNILYKEWSLEPGAILKVNSSRPVLVVVYTLSSDNSAGFGDAAMAVMTPVERYDSEYGLSFEWEQLIAAKSKLLYNLSIYSHAEDGILDNPGFHINSQHEFDMMMSWAKLTTSKYLAKDSFPKSSNLIMSVSTLGSSMIFPVGMRINFFTGADNCSSNPCHNQGICYMVGNNLRCFCGNQLNGTMCENDIYNGCQSSPCLNGGTCTDRAMDFKCECQANFTGQTCDSVLTTTLSTTTATTTPAETTVKKTTTPLSTTSIKTTAATPKTTSTIRTTLTFKAASTDPLFTTSATTTNPTAPTSTTGTPSTKTPTTKTPTTKIATTKTPTTKKPTTKTPTTETPTTKIATTETPTTKIATTKTPTTKITTTKSPSTQSTDVPSKKLCRCLCNNITWEKMRDITQQTKKDLGVNPKSTHKVKIKSESTYDERPTAVGIGILGVLFLSLVFGSIVLLDLLSASLYIATWFKNWRPQHSSERAQHTSPKDNPAITRFNEGPYSEAHHICSRSYIIMPRIKLATEGLLVVGRDSETFVMRRPSWSLRKELVRGNSASDIVRLDLGKHDAEDFCSGYVSDDTAELVPSSLVRSQSVPSLIEAR